MELLGIWLLIMIIISVLTLRFLYKCKAHNFNNLTYNVKEGLTMPQKKQSNNKPCVIQPLDGNDPITISDPWYSNPYKETQCYAPAGQTCCNQTILPNGDSGCMVDFGPSPSRKKVIGFNKGQCITIELDELV